MRITRKCLSLGALSLALLIAGCGQSDHDGSQMATMQHQADDAGPDHELMALIEQDDAAYLTQLGLMRGHLQVGAQLYLLGEYAEAVTHMKHPESELYAELVPGLMRRGAPAFADELESFALAVEAGADDDTVQQRYEQLVATIIDAEAAVPELSTPLIAAVIAGLLQHVDDEYALAVNAQGALINLHEYQDAMGFVSVADAYARQLAYHTERLNVVQSILTQLEFLQTAFPGVMPPASQRLATPDTISDAVAAVNRSLTVIE